LKYTVMFLKSNSGFSKLNIIAVILFWHTPALAHGDISSVGGFVEVAYYLALAIVSLPLAIAIAIRKNRDFTNWLMINLILPTIVFLVSSIFFSSVALYFATTRDVRMGIIFGVMGLAQIFVIQRLYVSCRKYHQTEA
jgi:hypothetical protein